MGKRGKRKRNRGKRLRGKKKPRENSPDKDSTYRINFPMPIRIKKSKKRIRSFLTYDLEWLKGKKAPSRIFRGDVWHPELRVCGVYDGIRYRWYRKISDFFDGELTFKNRGKWFYAHAGGLADMMFLLPVLVADKRYSVRAHFSGSSAIIVQVTRGTNRWTFVDSLWLIRAPLASIAKAIGMEKGDVAFDTENFAELVEYNELDCVILHRAIQQFEDRILNLGGELKMTQASCALELFKRRFLQRDIETSPVINRVTRDSYFASRVEPFKKRCTDAHYYDINSSFPHAMTFDCPGNFLGHGTVIMKGVINFARVTIKVPDDCYFPPVPKRYKQSVFFPVGQWEGWYADIDLELLEEYGGEIIKVHEVMYFEKMRDLADYAETLYEMRRTSTNETDRMVYKLLLNSLYGKFAESGEKTSLLINPKKTPTPEELSGSDGDIKYRLCFPGAYFRTEVRAVAHAHVPISSYITARARAALYRFMADAGDFYYCDTDGFATDNPNVSTGDKLGELKHEKSISEGLFLMPKFYMMDGKAKAKGMSLKPEYDLIVDDKGTRFDELDDKARDEFKDKYGAERFLALMNNHEIEMRRFGRPREIFGRAGSPDDIAPTERIITKRLRRVNRPKRKWIENGDSRPWHTDELED